MTLQTVPVSAETTSVDRVARQSWGVMSRFVTHRDSDAGMTVAEVLIAASILLVCLTALAAVLGGVIASSAMARSRDEAMNLANARLEIARSIPYDSVGVRYADGRSGEPSGTILTPEQVGRFVVETECSWIQSTTGRPAYKQVKVTVSWLQPVPGKVEVNTIIYGKSTISGSGAFLVKLRYRESSDPVANSDVTLVAADGSLRTSATNAAGEVLFGQVPVGACTLAVAPPAGYIVDATTLVNAAVSADAVSTAIVYLQHPAAASVHVIGMDGAEIPGAAVTIQRSDGAVIASAVSGSDGRAAFGQLLYGDYTATVAKAGYASASLPFEVSTTAAAPVVEFRMSPSIAGGIRIRVFDSNGTQVPGATVVLATSTGTFVAQGTTGTNGEITFVPPALGTYIATVSKSSYVNESNTVVIVEGSGEVVSSFHLAATQTKGDMHLLTKGKNNKLESLRVVVSGPGGYFASTLYSDSNGELWLRDLVPGSYAVQIYNDSGSAVTAIINAGQTADVSVSQRN